MKNQTVKNKPNLKDAVVEQIILWIVIFISFVSILFFIIDYSNALKASENADSIANYTARMVALNESESDIADGINRIKGDYVQAVTTAGISCTEDTTDASRQVIVNVSGTLPNNIILTGSNNINSKAVVYNESSEYKKECSIALSFN